MNGGTPLIDKLLATPAMQRSDLVPLKGQLALLQPDAVTDIEAGANDTRLPSRAGIDRQLGVDPGNPAQAVTQRPAATSERGATLSPAARVISEILGAAPARVDPVRASVPLWTGSAPPLPPQLAAALLLAVGDSGLFYESHLLQFASGERSLAQLTQEPQAALGQAAPQRSGGSTETVPQRGNPLQPIEEQALRSDEPVVAAGKVALPLQAGSPTTGQQIPAFANVAGAQAKEPPSLPVQSGAPQSNDETASTNPRVQAGVIDIAAAYRVATGGDMGAAIAARIQERAAAAPVANNDPLPSNTTAASMVHPEAVQLVRQQLELMALSQFRWSGEAWPQAKTEWEIQEHDRRQESPDGADAAPRRWSTRLAMTLPRLGAIELRLSMLGDSWHAHLAAADEASLASMRADGDQLRQRFLAAGMQLSGLQLAKMSVSTNDNTSQEKNDDNN